MSEIPRRLLAIALALIGGALGLGAGYFVWVIVWSLPWFEDPWVVENGSIKINNLFEALGKVITFVVFPLVAAGWGLAVGAGLAGGGRRTSSGPAPSEEPQ